MCVYTFADSSVMEEDNAYVYAFVASPVVGEVDDLGAWVCLLGCMPYSSPDDWERGRTCVYAFVACLVIGGQYASVCMH